MMDRAPMMAQALRNDSSPLFGPRPQRSALVQALMDAPPQQVSGSSFTPPDIIGAYQLG